MVVAILAFLAGYVVCGGIAVTVLNAVERANGKDGE